MMCARGSIAWIQAAYSPKLLSDVLSFPRILTPRSCLSVALAGRRHRGCRGYEPFRGTVKRTLGDPGRCSLRSRARIVPLAALYLQVAQPTHAEDLSSGVCRAMTDTVPLKLLAKNHASAGRRHLEVEARDIDLAAGAVAIRYIEILTAHRIT